MTETAAEQTEGQPRRRAGRGLVMRTLLAHYPEPRYLEVGVSGAKTFDKLEAPVKVAVDPAFRFDHTDPARAVRGTEYHQVTSDEYFGSVVDPAARFDVIFLDGLHTVEQTLRDLLNALEHLAPNGVIVIDDVRPPSALAAIPDEQEFLAQRKAEDREDESAWMGDVFRLVYFIDTFCQQLSFRVIRNNHGQAVVWRHRRPQVTDRGLAGVGAMDFDEMVRTEDTLRLATFADIVSELRRDLGLSAPEGTEGGSSRTKTTRWGRRG